MDEQGKGHQISRPRVNRTDQPAKLHFGHEKLYGLVGLAGAGPVIEKKQNSRGDLNQEEEKRHPAEVIPNRVPVNRHLFFLGKLLQLLQTDPFVKPGPELTVFYVLMFHAHAFLLTTI